MSKSDTTQKVLAIIAQQPITRKELILNLGLSTSAIDTHLRILLKEQKIQYEVIDTRNYRASGIGNFVPISNPKVRVYTIKKNKI